jgi:hypothetical protein
MIPLPDSSVYRDPYTQRRKRHRSPRRQPQPAELAQELECLTRSSNEGGFGGPDAKRPHSDVRSVEKHRATDE